MSIEPMYLDIYKKIKNSILDGTFKNNEMIPTEQELTKKYFASRITVRKALQMLMDEGYIRRIPGRGTYVKFEPSEANKDNIIGVVLCHIANSFGVGILTSIEKYASQQGYSIIFKNTYDDIVLEEKHIEDLVSAGVKGMIIQPVHGEFYNEKLIKLHLRKFPVILVDRHLYGFPIPAVATNNIAAIEDAVMHLFENGHENIAFICFDPTNTSTIDDRINGFKSAFLKNKKLITPSNILSTIKSPGNNRSEVWEEDLNRIKRYLEENPQITAIIASEYTVAKLVLQAISEMEKKIPDDYSFIMFDEADSIIDYKITHIRQNQEELGRMALEILLKKINDEITTDKVYIAHELVKGATVRKIK